MAEGAGGRAIGRKIREKARHTAPNNIGVRNVGPGRLTCDHWSKVRKEKKTEYAENVMEYQGP